MMVWLTAALVAVLGVALVVATARRARRRHVSPPRREAWDAGADLGTVVRLDVAGADPDDGAVQRLAHDAAWRALGSSPELTHVEVRDRDGRILTTEHRRTPHREVTLPPQLSEPHVRRDHGPSPVPTGADHPGHVPAPPMTLPEVALADRLDLPASVRDRITHPDRAADVVHAILLAAGRPSTVDGDLIRCGDVAIVVVDPRSDPDAALTHGYLRVEATDARQGLVIRTGYVDPRVVRRREAAAPHVRHVGPDALQRMADAVAVGADPVVFAAGPVVTAVSGVR